jgi:hypothetical protein
MNISEEKFTKLIEDGGYYNTNGIPSRYNRDRLRNALINLDPEIGNISDFDKINDDCYMDDADEESYIKFLFSNLNDRLEKMKAAKAAKEGQNLVNEFSSFPDMGGRKRRSRKTAKKSKKSKRKSKKAKSRKTRKHRKH